MLGPPGAGKRTHTEALADEAEYAAVSTGDAFREIARQQTPLGRRVRETIDQGRLASPSLAAEVITDRARPHVEAGRRSNVRFEANPIKTQSFIAVR